ncbi:hypothetical protein J4204_02120 [Candidatus Woesearchaeota archaeon]|nr:hypothetical protein [Candidatus Woesearchaeota archaeon]
MRGLVIFVSVLVFMASFGFIASAIFSEKAGISMENNPKQEAKQLEFSTFTSAVCEKGKDVVKCRDEFFVNCNGTISKAVDVAECEGIKVEVPKALGFATFSSDWKDPRQ